MLSSAPATGMTARSTGEEGSSLVAAIASGAPLARCAASSSPSGTPTVVTWVPSGSVRLAGSPPNGAGVLLGHESLSSRYCHEAALPLPS